MSTKIVSQSDTEVVLNVTAKKVELEPVVRQVFNQLRPNVKAAGFRPGRAPNDIVEKELGSQRIQAEVIEAIAHKAYNQAVNEHQLTPIDAPKVELTKFVPYQELEMKITCEVIPPVKLADYKKFKKTRKLEAVSDKEIDQVMEGLRIRAADRQIAKGPAKEGNEVEIDFEGKLDGEVVEGAHAHNYQIVIGSKRLVPGFESGLIGLKAGANKQFDITFPKDYFDARLKGKKVKFEVKVHKVTELKLDAIDDKFAAKVGPFKDLKQLKSDIKKQIER